MTEMTGSMSFVSPGLLDKFRCENRCLYCKKQSFEDKVTCEKCLEFEYCSVQCLELDRAAHQRQCDIIGLKKGRRIKVSLSYLKAIQSRAKLLDDENNIRDENEAVKLLDAILNVRPDESEMNSLFRNNTNKKLDGSNTSKVSAPAILSTIVSGKFGGPTKCGRRELSGVGFGQGWWKTGRKTAEFEIKPSGASLNTVSAPRRSKLKFKDFYPEFDENVDEFNSCINGWLMIKGPTLHVLFGKLGDPLQTVFTDTSIVSSTDRANDNDAEHQQGALMRPLTKERNNTTQRRLNRFSAAAGPPKCSHCGKESNSLKLCSRCSLSRYCDQTCQMKDHSRHKEHCKRERRFWKAKERFVKAVVKWAPPEFREETMKYRSFKTSVILEIIESDFISF